MEKIKTIEIPQEFKRLFDNDWREAAVHGGRYSLKSHTVARFLLIRARERKTRVACFREFQSSIAESSHQLLSDLINLYELNDFEITNNSIINRVNGSDFIFKGLWNNEQSIKSIEGIDIAWVEEAQTVSAKSIEVLTPTIRKDKSKIIYTYNRLLEDDPVHQRLVIEGRPDTLIINVNYDIAVKYKMIPDVVLKEIEDDKVKRPKLYNHKWLGEPNSLELKIYTGWKIIDEIPHTARLERYGLNFGYSNHPLGLVAVYYHDGGYIIDQIMYGLGYSNRNIADILKNLPKALVIADSAEPKSIQELKDYGLNVVGCEKKVKTTTGTKSGSEISYVNWSIQVVQGEKISITRNSSDVIREYKNYFWMTDRITGKLLAKPEEPFHYIMDCLVAGTKVKTINGDISIENIKVGDLVYTRKGLRKVKDAWLVNKQAKVFKIKLSNGQELTGTPNHRIWCNGKWKLLTDVRYGDIMDVCINQLYTKEKNTSVVQLKENTIITVVANFCIGKYGKKLMEKYRRIIMSIIKMVLKMTTELKILNSCIKENTDKTIIETEFQSKRNVKVAENNLKQNKIEKKIDFAPINVKANGEEMRGLMMLKNVANGAIRFIKRINIGKQDFVPVRVVEKIEKKEREAVYDITVEGQNEYYANGILVHNSIRYAVCSLAPVINKKEYINTEFLNSMPQNDNQKPVPWR